jgi:hypothetical protein
LHNEPAPRIPLARSNAIAVRQQSPLPVRIIRICLGAIDPTTSFQKLSFRPRGGNAQAPHRCDTTGFGDRVMDGKYAMNAFKHAFPNDQSGGTVRVTYDVEELN